MAYVPVPTQWLGNVYSLLATLSEASGAPRPEPEGDDSFDAGLALRMYTESEEQQKRLMHLLADHPDAWRYSKELAADLGLRHGARALAGMFGAFGRRAKHRYGGKKPWESEWDAARAENRYRMSADIAAVIVDATD